MTPDGKNDMILSVPAYLPGRYAGCADMAELADATVLGAVFERSAGSSPVIRIKKAKMMIRSFSPFLCAENGNQNGQKSFRCYCTCYIILIVLTVQG